MRTAQAPAAIGLDPHREVGPPPLASHGLEIAVGGWLAARHAREPGFERDWQASSPR